MCTVKCYYFKTYCNCAPFWYDSTKAAMKSLNIAYNISLNIFTRIQYMVLVA